MCVYVRSRRHGGGGGRAFSDNLTEVCALVGVNIRSGSRIDAIQGVWVTPSGARVSGELHGGRGGRIDSFLLEDGEVIIRVDGRSGRKIDQLRFTTNRGRTFGPFGGSGGSPFSISNLQVEGFFGSSGAELDAIGFFSPGVCP